MEKNKTSVVNKVDETTKKERSPLYTIKQFGVQVDNVEKSKLLTRKEVKELRDLQTKMIGYYMGTPMFEEDGEKMDNN